MQRIAQDSFSPSLTESLKPGTLYAMAGVAMALASITTKPHPSLCSELKLNGLTK